MKFIIFILFISSMTLPKDTLNVNSVPKIKDTLTVANNSTQKVLITNEQSFFEKYQPLFGSFLAAIIALSSIWLTQRIQRRKAKMEYFGHLTTIHSILVVHQIIFDNPHLIILK
jgi:hypothetical protein